jgi:predicted aminopeptidase
MRSYGVVSITLTLVALLSACSTVSYYAQSVGGQLTLISRREPIEKLLSNPALDADLKKRLEVAQKIRKFASSELLLPDNDSYRSYVQLEHPFVVWSVFATPEFSLQPRQWCFPVAGCVPYRGYFAHRAADAFAQGLSNEGLDVFVGGVPAYSTLGWFDDPLLSSMLARGETDTAAMIFHELAHQEVYVPGDTAFNEAFAVSVEKAGVHRWLADHGGREAVAAYEQAWQRRQDFFDVVQRTRARLAAVYRSDMGTADMRKAKQQMLMRMRVDYKELRRRWDGFDGYDYWFDAPINNAKLAAVAIYRDLVPEFDRLLAACGGDFQRFYGAVASLSELQAEERRVQLNAARSCL